MRNIAFVVLAVCWVLWFSPFVIQVLRMRGRKSAVTVSSSKWGLLLQAVAYFLAWFRMPGVPPMPMLIASLALGPLSVLCAWSAIRHLGKQWRIQAGLYRDHELIRTGPYRIVRHPVYCSMLTIFLATGFVQNGSLWLIPALVIFIIGTEIRVRVEDRLLASHFGGEFAAYRAKVPAYIPFIR